MRRLTVPCAALLLFFGLHALLIAGFAALPQRIEGRPFRCDLTAEEAITAEELERCGIDGLAYGVETSGTAGGEAVHLCLTNGAYGDFAEFTMIAGSYFTGRASSLGLRVAVISDRTAFSQFGALEAVGNALLVDGISYTVCGVYRQPWRTLTADGLETVYLPAGSGDGRVRHILLPAREDSAFAADDVRGELRGVSLRAENYRVRDFSRSVQSVRQPRDIAWFFLALLLAAAMIRIGAGIVTQMRELIGEQSRTKSLREIARSAWWMKQSALLFLLTGLTAVLLCTARFELYLPARLLPPDSIFNIAFYKELIENALVERNTLYAYRSSSYELCWQFAQTASVVLALLEASAGVRIYSAMSCFFSKR